MRRYFVQDGAILPDFCYEALRAAEYANWLSPGAVCVQRVLHGERVPAGPGTPIGSIEFVESVGRAQGFREFAPPLNLPAPLAGHRFAGRRTWRRVTMETVPENLPNRVFAKSAAIYKGFTGLLERKDLLPALEAHGPLDLSEEVEFGDEWRAFIHAGQLVGLHCYTGLFSKVPSPGFVARVIESLQSSYPGLDSCTVDIGFIGDDEAVVEVHPFVACGLYGFRDHRLLLPMFDLGYKALVAPFWRHNY